MGSHNMLLTVKLTTALLLAFTCALREESIDRLRGFEKLVLTSGAVGPESLAFDRYGGGPYTGVSDGRILKWQGGEVGWAVFAVPPGQREGVCDGSNDSMMESICGRPLGLQFHNATGDLYIADAYFGLLVVGPEGGVASLLVAEADGGPFQFTNGLDIDQENGMVYFTDSSTSFHRRDFLLNVMTSDATARLMRYNPTSKEVSVLAKGLAFANGVAMGEDNTFLLVAETSYCRILRYWLRGPRTGTIDIFAKLPGYPDNIKRNARGEFWVALNMEKIKVPGVSVAPLSGLLAEHPVALRLSREGRVLEGLDGTILNSLSEVEENNGTLWIGSVIMPYVGVYKI